jgi:hypothetical protein
MSFWDRLKKPQIMQRSDQGSDVVHKPASLEAAEVVSEFIPGYGEGQDINALYEELQKENPSKATVAMLTAALGIGMVPGAGDLVVDSAKAVGRRANKMLDAADASPSNVPELPARFRRKQEEPEFNSDLYGEPDFDDSIVDADFIDEEDATLEDIASWMEEEEPSSFVSEEAPLPNYTEFPDDLIDSLAQETGLTRNQFLTIENAKAMNKLETFEKMLDGVHPGSSVHALDVFKEQMPDGKSKMYQVQKIKARKMFENQGFTDKYDIKDEDALYQALSMQNFIRNNPDEYVAETMKNYGINKEQALKHTANERALAEVVDEHKLVELADMLPSARDPEYPYKKELVLRELELLGLEDPEKNMELINGINHGALGRDKWSDYAVGGKHPMLVTGQKMGTTPGNPLVPNEKAAKALGFNEDVFHWTPSTEQFTEFDVNRGSKDLVQDRLGVHVGTTRAAADRAGDVRVDNYKGGPEGQTMRLRARTNRPLDRESFKEAFGIDMVDFEDSGLNWRESEITGMFDEWRVKRAEEIGLDMDAINEMDMWTQKTYFEAIPELDIDEFRQEITDKGFTHIPYVNDVEDKDNISYIMMIGGEEDDAVLRDWSAEFDPEKIKSKDLRFNEGGFVTRREK